MAAGPSAGRGQAREIRHPFIGTRQIIFFIPAALILPTFMGVEGVPWTGPGRWLAFVLSLVLLLYAKESSQKEHALRSSRA